MRFKKVKQGQDRGSWGFCLIFSSSSLATISSSSGEVLPKVSQDWNRTLRAFSPSLLPPHSMLEIGLTRNMQQSSPAFLARGEKRGWNPQPHKVNSFSAIEQ